MRFRRLCKQGPMSIRITALTEENLRDAPEWEAHPWSGNHCLYGE